MTKNNSATGGVLTAPTKQSYNKHTVAGEVAPSENTISAKRRADREEYQKKLASKSSTYNGLPAPKDHPDYVFSWISTDPKLSDDNVTSRLLNDWEFASREEQPELHAALSIDTPLVASTGNSVERIRFKELVLMKLRKGYHDALMEQNHIVAPKQAEEDFINSTVDAFNEYGAIDPSSRLKSGFQPDKYRLVSADE